MTDSQIIHIATQFMLISAKLSAPVLVTALAIGFAVSLFQSATQIQEFTLAFVPKALGVGTALVLSGSWMLHSLVSFTHDLVDQLPSLLA